MQIEEFRTRSVSAVGKHAFDQSAPPPKDVEQSGGLSILHRFVYLYVSVSCSATAEMGYSSSSLLELDSFAIKDTTFCIRGQIRSKLRLFRLS